jgi:Fungal specific transcription factor domain
MIGSGGSGISGVAPIAPRSNEDSAYCRYVRGTSRLDPLLLENVPFDGKNEALLGSAKFRKIGSRPGVFVEIQGSYTSNDARDSLYTRLRETVPPADVDFLVQSFFEVVHPVFPILDAHSFRLSFASSSVEPLLLVAICVVARAWLSTIHRTPRQVDLSSVECMLWEHLRASLDRPSIATLQAGLLLLQCPNHTYQQFSSQLMLAAFDLGLHHDCSGWTIDPTEICSRRRLAWALYAQDKWTSLLHGRPAHMTEANWMVKDLSEDDFDGISGDDDGQKAASRHCASLFMQLIVLSQLLAEILQTFYTLSAENEVRASGANGLKMVLESAKPVQIKLKDWFSHLPASMKMDAAEDDQAFCNGILHLAYFATEIALHRCIIQAGAAPGTDTYVAHICRSAAKTRLISAMDFVNRLRSSHFRSSWPLASVSNFGLIGSFGVILRATAPTREEAGFYRARLEEYRWTLAVSSRIADFLDASIHQLDTSTELLQHVPEKPQIAEFLSMNPHVFDGGRRASAPRESAFNLAQERASEAFTGFSSPTSSMSSERDLEIMESA